MPRIQVNGADLHYEDTGHGEETIVFAHGLLFSGRMFDAQVSALRPKYRCITFDFRGQGQSEMTASGYDMDTLTGDALALIEKLNAGPCHFVGLSMGGFVGMRIAVRRPELLRTLTLMETSADAEPPENVPKYLRLGTAARWLGLRLIANKVMPIMFAKSSLENPARAKEVKRWRKMLIDNRPKALVRALRGVTDRVPPENIEAIRAPTLVIVGDEDVATKPEKAQRIHERIPGSRLVVLKGAGHSSSVEVPHDVIAALVPHLSGAAREGNKAG